MRIPISLCCLLAIGCQPAVIGPISPKPSTPPPPEFLDAVVTSREFSGATNDLASEIRVLRLLVSRLQTQLDEQAIHAERQFHTHLDPTAKGFQSIATPLGTLLLTDTESTPYLDGFSVRFKIGNLTSANLSSVKVTAQWGPPFLRKGQSDADAIEEYFQNQHTNEYTLSEVLVAGRWTPVELKVTPADATTIRNLRIQLVPTVVNMPEPK